MKEKEKREKRLYVSCDERAKQTERLLSVSQREGSGRGRPELLYLVDGPEKLRRRYLVSPKS